MSRQQTGTHSFVVKIWAEDDADTRPDASEVSPPESMLWRGSVTHVHTRKRVYFYRLPHVVSILAPYVHDMGGEIDDLAQRIVSWVGDDLPDRSAPIDAPDADDVPPTSAPPDSASPEP